MAYPMDLTGYEKVLREDADNFALTVAVYAEAAGRAPVDVAREAIQHALARLTERGALGGDDE